MAITIDPANEKDGIPSEIRTQFVWCHTELEVGLMGMICWVGSAAGESLNGAVCSKVDLRRDASGEGSVRMRRQMLTKFAESGLQRGKIRNMIFLAKLTLPINYDKSAHAVDEYRLFTVLILRV
jgi:hypothetical protein